MMAVVIGIDPYVDRFTLLPKTYDNKTTKPYSSSEPSNRRCLACGMTFAQLHIEQRV
jgi:hypothetical protein